MIKRIMVILLLIFLLIPFFPFIPFFPYAESSKHDVREWTFMVYLTADNNLEGAGIEDINEMEVAGSTADVNIIVEIDRAIGYDTSNGDWTDTKRYYVTHDPDGNDGIIDSEIILELGERNHGDKNSLVDFVLWTTENYPAKHYLLCLWNHGGGFHGACWDDNNETEEDDDWLTMQEVKMALTEITTKLGRDIDILTYDACSMSAVSVRYQTITTADITIGSGPLVPGEGWPYDTICTDLINNPAMTPSEFAKVIVDRYVESYEPGEGEEGDVPDATLAAFDMHKFNELSARIDEFAMVLATYSGDFLEGGYNPQIRAGMEATYHYGINLGPVSVGSMYDVRDFAYKIKNVPLIEPLIKERAEALINAIDAACIHFAITTGISNMYPQVRGLSIYIPADINQEYNEVYDELDFAKHKYWDEFIHYFKEKKNAENTPPAICVTAPVDDLIITEHTFVIGGTAFDVASVEKVEVKINDGEWVTVNGAETWSYEWKTSPGKHTIYARSFDGTGYSTVSSVNVDVVSEEKETEEYSWSIVFLLMVTAIVFLAIITVIKKKRGLRFLK